MAHRQQRQKMFHRFNFAGGLTSDVLEYTPQDRIMSFGIYPALGSGLPDLPKAEVPTRPGVNAPKEVSLLSCGASQREIGNEVYTCYVIGLAGGVLPINLGDKPIPYGWVAFVSKDGKLVKTVTGSADNPSPDGANAFASYAFQKMDFDDKAREVEAKNLVTKINPVDEKTLSHFFDVNAILGGGVIYSLRMPCSVIHENNRNTDSTFKYFKRGYVWPRGENMAAVLEDFTGKYHIAGFGKGGRMLGDARIDDFQNALICAANFL